MVTFEDLDAMSNRELDRLAAVDSMGWEVISEYEDLQRRQQNDYGSSGIIALYGEHWVLRRQGKSQNWSPTTDMNDAMELANKFGIALIPQSADNGFTWYACDIESVSYRGSEIAIRPLGETGLSQDTATRAITICSILATNKKIQ